MRSLGRFRRRSFVTRWTRACLAGALAWILPEKLACAEENLDQRSPEAILRSRLIAMGGEDSLRAVNSRRTVGRIKFLSSLESAVIIVEAAAPDYLRTTIELSGAGRIIEAYDGVVAWRKLPDAPAYKLSGAEAARVRRAADFYWDLNLETSHSNWTLIGTEPINGALAYHLSGVDVSQRRIHLWLDCETWLLSGMERVGWFGPLPAEGVRVHYADHRSIDGIRIPFLVRQTRPEASAFELRVESVTHGIEIDKEHFLWSAQASPTEGQME